MTAQLRIVSNGEKKLHVVSSQPDKPKEGGKTFVLPAQSINLREFYTFGPGGRLLANDSFQAVISTLEVDCPGGNHKLKLQKWCCNQSEERFFIREMAAAGYSSAQVQDDHLATLASVAWLIKQQRHGSQGVLDVKHNNLMLCKINDQHFELRISFVHSSLTWFLELTEPKATPSNKDVQLLYPLKIGIVD